MHTTERADRLAQLNAEREQARRNHAYHARVASESQDESYAAETEGARRAKVATANLHREHAGRFAALVMELSQEISALQEPVRAVVVTPEAGRDMEDTINFQGVPA